MSRAGALIVAVTVAVTVAVAVLALAACFGPSYAQGLPCSERATCPPGQTCGGDGVCRGSSVAEPHCGDGVIDDGETCDDGDTVDTGNGCSADCRKNAVCGDGVVQALYEDCEPGGLAACAPDCTPAPSFVLGGTVTGLAGSGLVLDGGELLPIAADGAFAFPTRRSRGRAYRVTVAAQPTSPWQHCEVTPDTGVIDGDVTDLAVHCTTSHFPVGGTVIGLLSRLNLLQVTMDGSDPQQVIKILDEGSFRLPTPIASGHRYRITAAVLPSPIPQDCAVEHGEGTVADAPVSDVVVRCDIPRFHLGGTVIGLDGRMVLEDIGGASVTVSGDGAFAFPAPMLPGTRYAVTVATQPLGQHCDVMGGEGTIGFADVKSITVSCDSCDGSLVPTMTSAARPSGQVSSSGETPGANEAWRAFDDSPSVWISLPHGPATWIRYEWGIRPRRVARYTISVDGVFPPQMPRDFSLWGLHGSVATELDRRTAVNLNDGHIYTFYIAQPGFYDGYELRVTDDNDPQPGVATISIETLVLMGEECHSGPEP